MNFASFDLNLLRVLDAMLREHNTTRAAEAIGLTQPAVSAALNRLRLSLGNPLFVRAGNAMVPTPYAEALRLPLRRALEQIEVTLAGADSFDPKQSTRQFRLFGSDYFTEMLLGPLLARLGRDAPGIRLQLLHQDPRNFVRQLGNDEIDFALVPEESVPDWVDRVDVFNSSDRLVCARGNQRLARAGIRPEQALPLDLFCDMPQIRFAPEGSAESIEDTMLAAMGRRRRVVLSAPEFYSIAHVAAKGDLMGLLPTRFAYALKDQLGLECYRVPLKVPMTRLVLHWHARYTDLPEHRWLRDIIVAILRPLDEISHPLTFDGTQA